MPGASRAEPTECTFAMALRAIQERRQDHLLPPSKAAAEVLDGTGGHRPVTLQPPAIEARSQAGAGQVKHIADCIEPFEPAVFRRIFHHHSCHASVAVSGENMKRG